ncbi:hypothetical protein ACQW02_08420 [Humitalea sp. 24SJ18S-53]|uniref:hypothetical protein n=1 Tax=Humitalea sp. 24SJ18S-53 TaxID=3422307 RepID=UPI003D673A7D
MTLVGAALESILWSLVAPAIFIPAIVLGWLARGFWVVIFGAVVIAGANIVMSLAETLPRGAERVFWLAPLGVVAPLVIGSAVFLLRRWLTSRDQAAPGSIGPRLVRCLIGLVLGGVIGFGIGLGVGLAVIVIGGVANQAGGASALVVFVFVFPGILIGMIVGAIIGWVRSRRV